MLFVVQVVAWLVLVSSTGAMALAWSEPRPDLSDGDAVAIATEAFEEIGFDAAVVGEPEPSTRRLDDGRDLEVLVVDLRVARAGTDDGLLDAAASGLDDFAVTVELQRDHGKFVWLDDVIGPDRSRHLLGPEEYAGFEAYRDDRAWSRQLRRNGAVTAAALLLAGLSVALIGGGTRLLRRAGLVPPPDSAPSGDDAPPSGADAAPTGDAPPSGAGDPPGESTPPPGTRSGTIGAR